MNDNTQPVIQKNFKAGDFLVPVDAQHSISSSIKILTADDKGYKCKRVNLSYNGEEFFMARDMMNKTKWVAVKEGIQLSLL